MPEHPHLEGITFRPFGGPGDYPDFARAITAAARAVGDDRVETAEGLASSYDRLQRCDRDTDLLVAEADGRAVAYSRVWWDQEESGPRIYRQVCFVDPSHGGRGIGSALFEWNDARLREVAAEHDVDDQQLEVFMDDRNAAALSLFRAAGFAPVAYDVEMIRPTVDGLPDHRLPANVEIRPVTDDQLRTIWEADEEAFRDHWGYVPPSEGSYERWLAFPYHDPSLWKIAWDDEGVAGQVRSFVDTAQNDELGLQRGWTEFISTSRRWRRRGLAKALIVESIRELGGRGITQVALGVHTENPNGAYDLYAGLGYEVVSTWTTYRKPL